MPKIPVEFEPTYDHSRLKFAPNISLRVPKSRDIMYDQIALFGAYEERLSRICRLAGRRGGLIVDVGANIGYFTCIFLAQNRSNRAVALEPSPRIHALLEENLVTNDLLERTTLHKMAASSRPEVRAFVEPSELTGWGKFGSHAFGGGERTYRVDCMPCDRLIEPFAKIRLMKIDVEGAELLVLQGAERILKTNQVETIYIEINKPGAERMGLDPSSALATLQSHNYKLQRIGPRRSIEDWIAFSPELRG